MLEKVIILMFTQLSLLNSCSTQNKNDSMQNNIQLVYKIKESKSVTVKSPMLLLLHGHGSNENDLFPFSDKIPDHWNVVSVRAPYKIAENSYRWYDVKMVNEKIIINIEEEEKSKKQLLSLMRILIKKYNVDSQKIIVMGFSQGANMAQSIGLSEPNKVTGFGVFSGRFVEEFIPFISKSKALKKMNAFLSHGTLDNMLPKTYAEVNRTQLKELGIQVSYCEDSNGHSISAKQWTEFVKWLLNFN